MGCLGSEMRRMWDVWDVEYLRCGMWGLDSLPGFVMLEMQDFGDVKCPGCGMWDVGFWPGSGMIMYKIPF